MDHIFKAILRDERFTKPLRWGNVVCRCSLEGDRPLLNTVLSTQPLEAASRTMTSGTATTSAMQDTVILKSVDADYTMGAYDLTELKSRSLATHRTAYCQIEVTFS